MYKKFLDEEADKITLEEVPQNHTLVLILIVLLWRVLNSLDENIPGYERIRSLVIDLHKEVTFYNKQYTKTRTPPEHFGSFTGRLLQVVEEPIGSFWENLQSALLPRRSKFYK